MNDRQMQLARHALGLKGEQTKSYRNSFVCGVGHTDFDDWVDMCQTGHATREKNKHFGTNELFKLTYKGALKSLKAGESLDFEDFPLAGKSRRDAALERLRGSV